MYEDASLRGDMADMLVAAWIEPHWAITHASHQQYLITDDDLINDKIV